MLEPLLRHGLAVGRLIMLRRAQPALLENSLARDEDLEFLFAGLFLGPGAGLQS